MAQGYIPAGGQAYSSSALFFSRLRAMQKDEVVGVLLAFFLGGFGAHRFYLRQFGWGTLYLLFFWTGIPALVALVECFLMPGRVRSYNLQQHLLLAAEIGEPLPAVQSAPVTASLPTPAPPALFCGRCGASQMADGNFCPACGAALATA